MTRLRAGLAPWAASLALLGGLFAAWPGTSRAAGDPGSTRTDWQARDTATYVVSTLNLVRQRNGQLASGVFQRRGIRSYTVYADRALPDLYFLTIDGQQGSALTLIYRMGQMLPQALRPYPWGLRIQRASTAEMHAARSDPRALLASFTALP